MALLPRHIGVAVDLAGCPNRCRHCYLGLGPNRKLPVQVLREIADEFRAWRGTVELADGFEQVDILSWYREPDFLDEYRQLYDLEKELSRCDPHRFELLSIWRMVQDPGYAAWAKEHGPRTCQITFFGMEKLTNEMAGRRSAFKDALTATECLLEVGMIPRWQIVLTKPALKDLPDLLRLAEDMALANRVKALGSKFVTFCHPPSPMGEAFNLENIRIEESDMKQVPVELHDATRDHFGGSIDWKPESELVDKSLSVEAPPSEQPIDHLWFLVNADLDVYSNYGDMTPSWKLGNFRNDGVDSILNAFINDQPPAMQIAFHAPTQELAREFGRKNSTYLYCESDLNARWVKLASLKKLRDGNT